MASADGERAVSGAHPPGAPGARSRVLTRAQARAFYDRFGARQDKQAFYEDPALAELILHAELESAHSVFEIGCGTGRLAERLMRDHLPESARYVGVDLSEQMVRLARERLVGFGERALVLLVDGEPRVSAPAGSFDRVVSTYVFDLLPENEIVSWLAEAERVLTPGGRLAVTGLTHGVTPLSRFIGRTWQHVHALSPRLVGGCRPLELARLLAPERWRVDQRRVVAPWGVPSEVVIASPLAPGGRPPAPEPSV